MYRWSVFFFFKQKTAYEMRISDWSSDVCSSDLPKPEARRIAAEMGLPVAEKPDSQDICFVPEGRYAAIVEKLRPGAAEPGEIVDADGRVLGRHRGIVHYTVGQRRGLDLGGRADHGGRGGAPEPLLVTRPIGRAACRERVGQYV